MELRIIWHLDVAHTGLQNDTPLRTKGFSAKGATPLSTTIGCTVIAAVAGLAQVLGSKSNYCDYAPCCGGGYGADSCRRR